MSQIFDDLSNIKKALFYVQAACREGGHPETLTSLMGASIILGDLDDVTHEHLIIQLDDVEFKDIEAIDTKGALDSIYDFCHVRGIESSEVRINGYLFDIDKKHTTLAQINEYNEWKRLKS